jgi:signal transduction histidine kinase
MQPVFRISASPEILTLPMIPASDPTPVRPPEHDAAQVVRHLAHELRQPLSALESFACYLDIVLPHGEAKARQQVDRIQQLIQQTNWIIDDAVHYLQASPPHPAQVALDEVVTQIIAERSPGKRLNLHLELAEEPCVALLDPQQARHLVVNVLNVFRQIAHAGPVAIKTLVDPMRVRLITSCASGELGVEELRRLFEPFSVHAPAGSGLALASVRKIVEAHEGRVEVFRSADGRLTLEIEFPSGQ